MPPEVGCYPQGKFLICSIGSAEGTSRGGSPPMTSLYPNLTYAVPPHLPITASYQILSISVPRTFTYIIVRAVVYVSDRSSNPLSLERQLLSSQCLYKVVLGSCM